MNKRRITTLSFGIALFAGALHGCTGPSVSGGEFAIEPQAVEDQLATNEGKTYAEVLLLDGSVDRARCGLLEGAEAVYQLFHRDDHGEFFFRTVREPDAEAISKVRISVSAMHLLLEAMRLIDELPAVLQRLPDPDMPYQARTQDLQWENDSTAAIAQEVMTKLQEPHAIADLIDDVSCSAFTLYRVAAELYESGQIG